MHDKIFGRANEWFYNNGLGISTFTIFMALALIVLVYYFIYAFEKRMGYSREVTNKFLVLFAVALAITYAFAWFFDRMFHYFESGIFEGGITYIAGFLGGVSSFVILVYFFMKEERKHVLKNLNYLIPGIILAHAIGRIGCFSVGCCYGQPTDSIFGVYFPHNTNPYIDGLREPIHPTQIYEAVFLFLLFFVLKLKYFKNNEFASYLIFYAIFRFILEVFFRGDSRGLIFGIAPSVILSIVMLLIGASILVYKNYFKREVAK